MTNVAQRSVANDANLNTGRYEVASATTSMTNTMAQVSTRMNTNRSDLTFRYGVLVRYTDTNNWLWYGLTQESTEAIGSAIVKRVGGTVTTIASNQQKEGAIWANVWWGLRLMVAANGFYSSWINVAGSEFFPQFSGYDSALATGGALASGKVGFYDARNDAIAYNNTRYYTAFSAYVPPTDAVVFASQSAELNTSELIREDSTGTAWSPISYQLGDLPRVPPVTTDNRKVMFFLKLSRGDLESLPDPSIDNCSAIIKYRPCYLFLGAP